MLANETNELQSGNDETVLNVEDAGQVIFTSISGVIDERSCINIKVINRPGFRYHTPLLDWKIGNRYHNLTFVTSTGFRSTNGRKLFGKVYRNRKKTLIYRYILWIMICEPRTDRNDHQGRCHFKFVVKASEGFIFMLESVCKQMFPQ